MERNAFGQKPLSWVIIEIGLYFPSLFRKCLQNNKNLYFLIDRNFNSLLFLVQASQYRTQNFSVALQIKAC